MSKPIIGISGSVIIEKGSTFSGYHRSYVNEDYVDAVIQAGGIPYIIPMNEDTEVIKQQIKLLDGLILSGGHDVTPLLYKQEPHKLLGETSQKRDQFDCTLIDEARQQHIPILGICRGLQILNVHSGGSLYQDLSLFPTETIKHDQHDQPTLKTHTVQISPNSILESIVNEASLFVNSFHHQVLDRVAPGFDIVATAPDGVIEAIERKTPNWELGVQWHPEMLHRVDATMSLLFSALVNEAKGD